MQQNVCRISNYKDFRLYREKLYLHQILNSNEAGNPFFVHVYVWVNHVLLVYILIKPIIKYLFAS